MIKLLDLYCKAGGCSKGYFNAANELGLEIEIIGVDIEPQKNYPFSFIQSDAIEYLRDNSKKFTHIHASPPCQKYSTSSAPQRNSGKVYSDHCELIKPILYKNSIPAVIENVMPAPIRGDVILRGDMFGLGTLRKRKFELINWFMLNPGAPSLRKGSVVHHGDFITCIGNGSLGSMNKQKKYTRYKKERGSVLETWSEAMGIDWMEVKELREAIPPAYTHYIGLQWFK